MIRSKVNHQPNEFDMMQKDAHVIKVMEKIDENFHIFFNSLLEIPELQKLREKLHAKILNKDHSKTLKAYFEEEIESFEKERKKYLSFFNQDSFQDFSDHDPKAFKAALKRECPIILKCIHSKREVMKVWKERFNYTKSEELLDTFQNLLDFSEDRAIVFHKGKYSKFNKWQQFGFDQLDEKDYSVLGVIGMGIQSNVLYHLNPQFFPRRSRLDLLGLFFLTDESAFELPSQTSEFVMINDLHFDPNKNFITDQNYWYPYSIFSFYALHLYRKIKTECEKLNVNLNDNLRYIYVGSYLSKICELKEDYIDTMLGGDEE